MPASRAAGALVQAKVEALSAAIRASFKALVEGLDAAEVIANEF